jgi:hypothetical protein
MLNTKFSLVLSVITFFLAMDVALSSISDLVPKPTIAGLGIFLLLIGIYMIGQFYVLNYIKSKITPMFIHSYNLKILNKIFIITQGIITSIAIVIVLQTVSISAYSTYLLNLVSITNFIIASSLVALLAIKFIVWYNLQRNFNLLLYGVAAASVTISLIFTCLFNTGSLLDLPGVRNAQSTAPIIFYELDTIMGKVQYSWATFGVVSFILLWSSSVLALYGQIGKLGKIKFWIMMSIPLITQISIFTIIIPLLSFIPSSVDKVSLSIFGFAVPGIVQGILFGTPFWIIAKKLGKGVKLKDYLIMTGWGLTLLSLSSTANIAIASFPIFGLVTTLFASISCYLILVGFFYSAISLIENNVVRKQIRKFIYNEAKLLESISLASLEDQLSKRVINITKEHGNLLKEKTGIESSLSDLDTMEYLKEIMKEIKKGENGKIDK